MKSNEMTPAQMHEMLKRNVFSDIDLERIASMDADQRRELKLSQIDKMLGKLPCADALGWYISKFVDDDNQRRTDNPLYDEEDNPLVAWYLDVFELSSNLYSHEVFSLDLLDPGLEMNTANQRQQFTIDNQPLMDWLQQTPYRRVAAMVARIMMQVEYDKVIGHNDAVQDYYAEHCSTGDFDPQDEKKADTFTNDAIEALRNAANELSQNWIGDGRDAFVRSGIASQDGDPQPQRLPDVLRPTDSSVIAGDRETRSAR